ncbi:hypothetical protein H8356DRAFT_1696253 [Neocallimastix lanati (nom. inval.)]|nr:hypothetical protein H8356DRAFT_1696253 [Neocallimastix sp. JGI-2020a]
MNLISRYFLIIVYITIFTRSIIVNRDNCNISNFGECYIALAKSTAKEQCHPDGRCPINKMDEYENCIHEIYTSAKESSNAEVQIYNKAIQFIGIPFSFVCVEADGEWCYDQFKAINGNDTGMHEFNCGKCGSKILNNYKNLLDSMENEQDSEDYQFIQKQISEIELCNNALYNVPLKITTFIIITIIPIIFVY